MLAKISALPTPASSIWPGMGVQTEYSHQVAANERTYPDVGNAIWDGDIG